MPANVYIKFNLSSKVHKPNVTVGDVAKVYCHDKSILNKCCGDDLNGKKK